jgi:hypothetical protein
MERETTIDEEIRLQHMRETGEINTVEDILLCQSLFPLYLQLYKKDNLDPELLQALEAPDGAIDLDGDYDASSDQDISGITYSNDKDELQYAMMVDTVEAHEEDQDKYEFSIDVIQALEIITKSSKNIWREVLLLDDEKED